MKKQIESLIYQYHWRSKELDRISSILWGAGHSRSVGISQYGFEATMPKPNTSLKSHAEMDVMDARERRQYERFNKFNAIVTFVESLEQHLRSDEEGVIYDCMLEGMSYRSIADHMGMSRNKLHLLKESMLSHLSQKSQKGHYVWDLANEKSVS